MKKLVVITVVIALIMGGVAWKVLASRADRPAAGSALLPPDYVATQEEQTWIDSHTGAAGAFVKKFGEYRFVLVTMGEKPTGGYAVSVDKVDVSDEGWVVNVKLVSPGPNDMVTQALTYPYGFVKIIDDGKAIKVMGVSGGRAVELAVVGE